MPSPLSRRQSSAATAFWSLDAMGAVLFAFGLAGAISQIEAPTSGLAPLLAISLTGVIARAAAGGLAIHAGVASARSALTDIRRDMVATALSGRAKSQAGVGALSAMVIEEVEAQEGYFSRYLPLRQAAIVAPVLICAAVAFASPICAGILIATLIPLVFILALVGTAAREAADRQFIALERLSTQFLDRVRALPLLLAFQAQDREAAVVERAARGVSDRTQSVLRVAFLSSAALEFFSALSVALVAVYCGFSLLKLLPFPTPEHLDLRRAVFALALAPEFYLPLRRLAAAYHDKQIGDAAAARAPIAIEAAGSQTHIALNAAPLIRFDGVVVEYDGGARLGPFSFEAAPGRITVLMGATGSGKTSLLKALIGLTPVVEGAVSLDGEPLLSGQALVSAVAWAGQTPVLVPGSIGDNISLADPSASRAEVEAAAAWAGLGPMLARRVGALDAQLDERGSGLSGGERRRVALARARLKACPILLLDEPTSDLDPRSEAELIELIRTLAVGRTVVIATHSPPVAAIGDHLVQLS